MASITASCALGYVSSTFGAQTSLGKRLAAFSPASVQFRAGVPYVFGDHPRILPALPFPNACVKEWGARDPTASEVESNFGDKVLGNEGTEHIKLIPPSLLGFAERSCTPLPPETVPLSQEEATALLRKVVGWRLAETDNGLKIWTEWKLKDAEAGTTLFDRIAAVAEAEEQNPELHLQGINIARAELSTVSIGGLSINDFILAAKIDKIKTSDLVKKNRFWA